MGPQRTLRIPVAPDLSSSLDIKSSSKGRGLLSLRSEKTIVNEIMRWLKKQPDVYAWKTVGTMFGRRGIPDICGNVGAQALFMEAKTRIGRVSPRQNFEHSLIKKAGAMVWIVRSLEDAQQAVYALRSMG